ncbi:MAG: hypothetical protein M1831_003159 [Alyxoria varia]|nr:MAG: hypothetical protein M1831_003159 [Alyxoria varia]
MSFSSSPLAYPPSSSPHNDQSPRKRRKIEQSAARQPLRPITNSVHEQSKTVAGFVVGDDSSDDEDSPYSKTLPNEHDLENIWDLTATSDSPSVFDPESLSLTEPEKSKSESHTRPAFDDGSPSLSQDPKPQTAFHDPSVPPLTRQYFPARTSTGKHLTILARANGSRVKYERMVAERSTTASHRAQKSYYGIDIHRLVDEANATLETRQLQKDSSDVNAHVSIESDFTQSRKGSSTTQLWTEKYRARKFTDLVGDERTHRSVLRWLKGWDSLVFPHQARSKPKLSSEQDDGEKRQHRKILLLAGPPGLGKTTLAHVCAKQAGYESQEINASDERSRDVVKNRIRDMVATESVRSVDAQSTGKAKKSTRPVCVVIDEVDGVVSGSGGGGEGGFIQALQDLLHLDQKNSNQPTDKNTAPNEKKKKGDKFRLMRPIILICNDVYHPSLRLLRQGSMAEIIHVRKPSLTMMIPRLQGIFEREGLRCDSDGVRRLCEAAWGVTSRKASRFQGSGMGEGDIRSILVIGEWAARKFTAAVSSAAKETARLSKAWLERHVLAELAQGGGAAHGLGRGGAKEVVERIFLHNGGFSATTLVKGAPKLQLDSGMQKATGASEAARSQAMERLRSMIESSGDEERIMQDCFASWPLHPFQDDTMFTKPSLAHDWLHFHGTLSHRLFTAQDWDLAPYLSFPVLAFHTLFASPNSGSTPNADQATGDTSEFSDNPIFMATRTNEMTRANHATLTAFHNTLNVHLQQSFRSHERLATELVPYTLRLLNPEIKPVLVGGAASVRRGAEKERVGRAVDAMCATGVKFDKSRVDMALNDADDADAKGNAAAARAHSGWIYRMEPTLDDLGAFSTGGPRLAGDAGKARYAVRQVLDQEWRREVTRREANGRMRRAQGFSDADTPGKGSGNTQATTEHGDDTLANCSTAAAATEAEMKGKVVKRDFFGRPVSSGREGRNSSGPSSSSAHVAGQDQSGSLNRASGRVWMSYHEGYSNAVKKPITMKELMEGL